MKTLKWFFTTNNDGENPAVMILNMIVGVALVFFAVWLVSGCLVLPTTKTP